ncbi:MAG: hypothetical protein CK425_03030 [Parachlamydia sp.]|nr:MAG: hypothetical protein CK425_03030 [Parachlamydia sp.]
MDKKTLRLSMIGLLLLLLVLWGIQFYGSRHEQEQLNAAENAYQAGEKAVNINERQKAFNEALQHYLSLEEAHHPIYGSGKFYYNLGNTYFQLQEYPLAILNYEKALNLLADPSKAEANLKIARKKAKVDEKAPPTGFQQVLFFHTWALSTRLQLISICLVLIFALISLSLWKTFPGVKTLIILLGILFVSLLASAIYSRFFSSIEAIVIHPTYLYRDAGLEYAKVQEQPLTGGTKVEVLGFYEDGEWVKILTSHKELGYIKSMDARLIDAYK